MIKTTSSKGLQGKDLINIGIYSAIYFVVVFVVAMLGYVPIFMMLLPVLVPIIAGIPFMLFLTKVKKFGMIWIMSIIMGLLMLLTGMSYHALIVGTFTGLIADLLYNSGTSKSSTKAILTSGVFSLWVAANYIPLIFTPASYWSTRQEFGQEYITTMTNWLPKWMCPVLFIGAFVCGIIGGFVGKAILRKHFQRAGIA
ncbi:MAG: MptD family putative ECF transporter S component [bacterium]|nr:MptD family putative ECF transporter S component [bacterium]